MNTNETKFLNIVMSQTTYTEEEATQKLNEYNNDYMKVIREYIGVQEKKETPITSINQEIFKQIRTTLDIKEYRDKNPINIADVIKNFTEEDEKQ